MSQRYLGRGRGIIYEVYKELLKISKRNAKYPIEKWGMDKNEQFREEMLTGLISLVTGELYILVKTAMRHLSLQSVGHSLEG